MAQGTSETAKKIKLDANGNPIVKKKIKLDADGKPIKKIKLDADGKPIKKAKPVETTVITEKTATSPKKKKAKAPTKKGPNPALIAGITVAGLAVASLGGVLIHNMLSNQKPEEVVVETMPPTTEAIAETEPATEPVTEPVTTGPEKQVVEVPAFIDCKVTGESIEKDLTMYIKNPDGKKLTGNKFQVLLVTSKNKGLVDEKVKTVKEINAKIEKAMKEATPKQTASTPSSAETSNDKYVSNDQVLYISSITGEELTEVEKLLIEKQEAYDEYAKALESVKGTIYKDDDGDGVISISKIDAGEYYAAFVPSESYIPATYTSKLTVKDKLEYKAVEEIKDKTVSEQQAGDTNEKNVTVEAELTDTVKYVETSSKDGAPIATKSSPSALVAATAASKGIYVETTKKPEETVPPTTEPPATEPSSSTAPATESSTAAPTEAPTVAPTEAPTEAPAAATESQTESQTPATEPVATVAKPTLRLMTSQGKAKENNTVLTITATTLYQTANGISATANITLAKPNGLASKIYIDNNEYASTTIDIKAGDFSAGKHILKATVVDANGETQTVPNIEFTVVASTEQLKDASGNPLFLDEAGTKPATVADYSPELATYSIAPGATIYYGWQEIEGKKYYYDENGNKVTGEQVIGKAKYTFSQDGVLLSSGLGIDVSKWQGKIDWKQASNTVNFAIVRCGIRGKTGELAIDSYCGTNIQNAKANGVKVGLYFYSRAQNEVQAVEEASLAVSIANQYGGVNLPIYIDMEDATQSGLTTAQRDAIVMAFCNTVKNSGYSAGIYANKNWLTNKLTPKNYSGVSIWVAQYANSCTYSGSYKMWQYTSTGSVPGISGNVDMNIMY